MSVIDEITAERKRQVETEGWSVEHDDYHSDGEMARAAACYAMTGSAAWLCNKAKREAKEFSRTPHDWPWDKAWWKPKDRRRDLIRAAALIVAEIERIDRQQSK